MTCPKCGKLNKEGASFCTECGRALRQSTDVNIKTHTGRSRYLVAGISVFAVIAMLIIYFVFFSGTPVEGQWYSEGEFAAINFDAGQAQLMNLTGMQLLEYEYNRQSGEGNIPINGGEYKFRVETDELTLQSSDRSIVFTRAKEKIDTEEIITSGLHGLWSNEKLALVLEFKENGNLAIHSIDGEQESVYDYDIENGEGSLLINEDKTKFSADNAEINIKGIGLFTKQNSGFDTAAFIEEFGNPLKGVWYDSSGVMGEFNFQDNGVLSVTSYGTEYQGTYSYSNAEDKGTLSFGNKTMDITCSAEVLKIKGETFTKNVVAQKDKSNVYDQIAGTWYDKQGNGTLQISKFGSAVFERDGNKINTVCTFDPLDGTGTITFRDENGERVVNLLLSDGILAAGAWIYTHEAVAPADNGVTGTWYDLGGRFGTLTLRPDGTAELISAGSTYNGSYTFDKALGVGTISTMFNGQMWEFDLELQGENLVIRTGILFYDMITFTRQLP